MTPIFAESPSPYCAGHWVVPGHSSGHTTLKLVGTLETGALVPGLTVTVIVWDPIVAAAGIWTVNKESLGVPTIVMGIGEPEFERVTVMADNTDPNPVPFINRPI